MVPIKVSSYVLRSTYHKYHTEEDHKWSKSKVIVGGFKSLELICCCGPLEFCRCEMKEAIYHRFELEIKTAQEHSVI